MERSPDRGTDPAYDAVAFDGTADVTLEMHSRGVFIATDGDLKVDMVGYDGRAGATVTFANVVGGSVLSLAISKIYNDGTTCSGVVLL